MAKRVYPLWGFLLAICFLSSCGTSNVPQSDDKTPVSHFRTVITSPVPDAKLKDAYPQLTSWDGDCDKGNNPGSYNLMGYPNGKLWTWKGIEPCGPVPGTSFGKLVHFYPGAWGEYQWQCTELVTRYLYLRGFNPIEGVGSQIVQNYTKAYPVWHQVMNTGSVPMVPEEGDVLSYGHYPEDGHTSIVIKPSVNSSGKGTIKVLQQNIKWGGVVYATEELQVLAWKIGDSPHGAGSVTSWMTMRPLKAVLGASTQRTPGVTQTPKVTVQPTHTVVPRVQPTPVPTQIPTPEPTKVPTPKTTPRSASGNTNVGTLPVGIPPNGAMHVTGNAIVNGSFQWNSTQMAVSVGQIFTIQQTGGAITVGPNGAAHYPSGDPSCVAGSDYTAPGLSCWILVGQIGTGSIFPIGNGGTFKSTSSGVLFLGINDNVYSDNVGSWSVTVTEYSVSPTVTVTPDMTPTPSPTPTAIPVPTEIPTIAPTPTPGPTVEPTPTPVPPTPTPTPTVEPSPTPTPESSDITPTPEGGKHKKH